MRLDWFERKVIFKMSRGLYLIFGVLGVLALVGAILLFAYGIIPAMKGKEPPKPQPPAPPVVALEEIKSALAQNDVPAYVPRTNVETGESGSAKDPTLDRTRQLIQEIQSAYFPENGFPWKAQLKRVCTNRWGNNCFHWETIKQTEGAEEFVFRAFKNLEGENRLAFFSRLSKLLAIADKQKAPASAPAPTPAPAPAAKADEAKPGDAKAEPAETGDAPPAEGNAPAPEPEKKETPLPNTYLAVVALVDVALAYKTPDAITPVMDKIEELLSGVPLPPPAPAKDEKAKADVPPAAPVKAAAPLAYEPSRQFFLLLMKCRKAGSNPAGFVAFLDSFPKLAPRFAEVNQQDALAAAWEGMRDMLPEQVNATSEMLGKLIAQVPGPDVGRAVNIFNTLINKKNQDQLRDYQNNMNAYEETLAKLTTDYETSKAKKQEYKHYALYGIAGAIGLIALLGLILSLLGIERNTRVMEQLLTHLREGRKDE